jgi:hypothetical protein
MRAHDAMMLKLLIEDLKSVAGSVPCQPISFHNSDLSGGISRVG